MTAEHAPQREVRDARSPRGLLGEDAVVIDVLRAVLEGSMVRLISSEPAIRRGEDPEGIHRARVATRRLRSDLQTFRSMLEPGWAESLRAELRWLGDLLGMVRDAEVLRARLQGRLSSIDDPAVSAGKALLDDLESRRLDGRRALLAAMRSPQYERVIEHLVRGSQDPAVLASSKDRPATELGGLMARPWARLSRRAGRLGAGSSDEALHGTRIAAKRVRYAAEAIAPIFGKRAVRFAASAENLQRALGEHQDAVVAMEWLTEQAERAPDAAVAFTAGRIVELEAAARAEARAAWPKAWKGLERRKPFWK